MNGRSPWLFVFHGFELDGSGSNLVTARLCEAWTRLGVWVALVCHEPEPERYPWIQAWFRQGEVTWLGAADQCSDGGCLLVEADLQTMFGAGILPVYNLDVHPGFEGVVAFSDLTDEELSAYLAGHVQTALQAAEFFDGPPMAVMAGHVTPLSEAGFRVARALSVPFLLMPHGSGIEYGAKADQRLFQSAVRAIRHADWLVLPGPELRHRIEKVFGEEGVCLDPRGILPAPMAVDTELFRPREKSEARERLASLVPELPGTGARFSLRARFRRMVLEEGLDGLGSAVAWYRRAFHRKAPDGDLPATLDKMLGGRSICFAGKLVAGKGIHVALAVMARLAERFEDLIFIVVGEGSFRPLLEVLLISLEQGRSDIYDAVVTQGWAMEGKTNAHLDHLEAYMKSVGGFDRLCETARRVRLADRVLFAGWLPHRALALVFNLSDVAVLPSVVPESTPLVLGESLASGLAMVLSGAGGAKDLLEWYLEGSGLDAGQFVADPSPNLFGLELEERLASILRRPGSLRFVLSRAMESHSWRSMALRILDAVRAGR